MKRRTRVKAQSSDATPKPWRVTSQRTAHVNPWFQVLRQRVRLPDGASAKYFTLDFFRPTVGIVARDGDRFLLTRQYRFIVDEYVWEIPAGGVDAGESPKAAAARELAEETGYRAARVRHLFTYYPSYGCSNQLFQVFLAEGLRPARSRIENNEVSSVGWFDRMQIVRLLKANKIVSGISLVSLLYMLQGETFGTGNTNGHGR